jgi:hypothetical protein
LLVVLSLRTTILDIAAVAAVLEEEEVVVHCHRVVAAVVIEIQDNLEVVVVGVADDRMDFLLGVAADIAAVAAAVPSGLCCPHPCPYHHHPSADYVHRERRLLQVLLEWCQVG